MRFVLLGLVFTDGNGEEEEGELVRHGGQVEDRQNQLRRVVVLLAEALGSIAGRGGRTHGDTMRFW